MHSLVLKVLEHLHWLIQYHEKRILFFSSASHDLYLALDRVETADDDEKNLIIFTNSKSAFQPIWGLDWMHPLVLKVLEHLHWLIQYHEKRILFFVIRSHVGIRDNEKADAAAKTGLLRRVINTPIPKKTKSLTF